MTILQRVLAGLGDYFIKQGEFQQKQAEQQMLMDREIALKQLDFQHEDQTNQANHAARMGEIAATGAENRRSDLFKGVIDERRDQAKDSRTLSHDITIKRIDLMNDKALEAFKTTNHLTEAQYQSLLDTRKDIAVNGSKIDRVVFSKDGQMQEVYGNGNIVSKGPKGAYNPGGAGAGDSLEALLGDNNSGATTASGSPQATGANVSLGASQARTAPTPAPQQRAAVLAQAGNLYAQASQNPAAYRSKYPGMFDPNGNLLPKEQIISTINQTYPGQ